MLTAQRIPTLRINTVEHTDPSVRSLSSSIYVQETFRSHIWILCLGFVRYCCGRATHKVKSAPSPYAVPSGRNANAQDAGRAHR